jgi:Tfp pilus assembly protein PilN
VAAEPTVLPETATVYWRPRADGERLDRRGRLWTLTTVAHIVPFVLTAALLCALS